MRLSPISMNWYSSVAVMPYGWGGNRRSGVALAMRYRLGGISMHLRALWSIQGDGHLAYGPHGRLYLFTARRYASAVCCGSVSVLVCLSQVGVLLNG